MSVFRGFGNNIKNEQKDVSSLNSEQNSSITKKIRKGGFSEKDSVYGSTIVEIAEVISKNNPVVLNRVQECVERELACKDVSYDSIWYDVLDILTDYDYSILLDWKSDAEDVLYCAEVLANLFGYKIDFEKIEVDNSVFTDIALETVKNGLMAQSYYLNYIDNDSDTFPLILLTRDENDKVHELAKSIGRDIGNNFDKFYNGE